MKRDRRWLAELATRDLRHAERSLKAALADKPSCSMGCDDGSHERAHKMLVAAHEAMVADCRARVRRFAGKRKEATAA